MARPLQGGHHERVGTAWARRSSGAMRRFLSSVIVLALVGCSTSASEAVRAGAHPASRNPPVFLTVEGESSAWLCAR